MSTEESWDSLVKQYIKDQPERNAKRLELLRQEQTVGNNLNQEIQHQEQNLDNFKAPKTVTKEKTVPPRIEFSPRMMEYFGIDSFPANSTSSEGKKLNKEMTVPIPEKPKGWLNDYLGGVVNRVIHPLEAAATAVKEWESLPPEEQAMSLVSPVGGLTGIFIGKGSKLFSNLTIAEKEKIPAIFKSGRKQESTIPKFTENKRRKSDTSFLRNFIEKDLPDKYKRRKTD